MELENIKKWGRYSVTADVSGLDRLVADNGRPMLPDRIRLTYRWDDGQPWRLEEAKVFGVRVLTGNRLGKEQYDRTFRLAGRDQPAWLAQLVGAMRPTDRDAADPTDG